VRERGRKGERRMRRAKDKTKEDLQLYV